MEEKLLTLEPEYQQWKEILSSNVSLRPALNEALGENLRRDIREEVLCKASDYTRYLVSLAHEAGIALGTTPRALDSWKESVPLIVSGHQPIVYHSGLLFKSQMLSQIVADEDSFGVNLVIDTDEGDGGAVIWPTVVGDSLELRRGSLAASSTQEGVVYGAQRVASKEIVRELFAKIESDLRESKLHAIADRASKVGVLYAALAKQPVAAAHTIVRWALLGAGCCEVLLSSVVKNTGLSGVIQSLARDGLRLVESYNSELNRYRREHRIENAANPFPNMKVAGGEVELPFWLVDGCSRKPLYARDLQGVALRPDVFVAPRASMTTLLVRAYVADLFVHGVGGGTYDRFVDLFASTYLKVRLPRFVVASRTRYLFPDEIARTSYEIELAAQFKNMVSRTEGFLGKEIFSAKEETELSAIISERTRLRDKLQLVKTDQERAEIAYALNDTNRKVRACIETGTMSTLLARSASNRTALQRWKCREFPFFMFKD